MFRNSCGLQISASFLLRLYLPSASICRPFPSRLGCQLGGLVRSFLPLVVPFWFGTYDNRRCSIDNLFPVPIVKIKF
jgi:hypothetical protein